VCGDSNVKAKQAINKIDYYHDPSKVESDALELDELMPDDYYGGD
jgi:hypothetical protein